MELSKDQIVDLMMGFFKTKTITSALELGIFDALRERPAGAQTICQQRNIPEASGKRLLIALTALGLLKQDQNQYSLTDTARQYLVSDSTQWLGWLARHIDTFLYPLWSHTAQAVREDSDQRKVAFGDNRSWFDILYKNPKDVIDFQEFLAIFAQPFVDGIVQSFDFSQYKKFMDIGSGIGSLPIAVAKRYPNIEIGICELPQATSLVSDKVGESGLNSRIKVVAGNVIEGTIPKNEYDLIHLGWMLHDYAPTLQLQILQHIHAALPPGGTFIASETPLADDESGPLFTALLSINMLVSTDGGIESTKQQYLRRFEEAGFVNARVIEISGPRTLFIGEKAK